MFRSVATWLIVIGLLTYFGLIGIGIGLNDLVRKNDNGPAYEEVDCTSVIVEPRGNHHYRIRCTHEPDRDHDELVPRSKVDDKVPFRSGDGNPTRVPQLQGRRVMGHVRPGVF